MRLEDWMKEEKKNQTWVASEIGVSSASISKYIKGISRPNRKNAEKIRKLTKGRVTPNDFDSVQSLSCLRCNTVDKIIVKAHDQGSENIKKSLGETLREFGREIKQFFTDELYRALANIKEEIIVALTAVIISCFKTVIAEIISNPKDNHFRSGFKQIIKECLLETEQQREQISREITREIKKTNYKEGVMKGEDKERK